jgi:hypothetical protein
MPPNPHNTGDATTVAIELEPGWLYVRTSGPKPERSRMELLLQKTIDHWFAERPNLAITKALAVSNNGELLGIHVWYKEAAVSVEDAKTPESVEFG